MRKLMALEYMFEYLIDLYPIIKRDKAEEIAELYVSDDWPSNLPEYLSDYIQDIEDFYHWEGFVNRIDQFLGNALRAYKGDLDIDDPAGGVNSGGPTDSGGESGAAAPELV